MRTVALPGGETVSAVGQGTWYMGERRGDASKEADALPARYRSRHDPDRYRRDVCRRRRRAGRRPGSLRHPRSGLHRQQGVAAECLAIRRAGSVRAEFEAAQDRSDRSISAALARRPSPGGDGLSIRGLKGPRQNPPLGRIEPGHRRHDRVAWRAQADRAARPIRCCIIRTAEGSSSICCPGARNTGFP